MLPVSLDCPFLTAPSVFSKVYYILSCILVIHNIYSSCNTPLFSGVTVAQSLLFCVVFYSLPFCLFSFLSLYHCLYFHWPSDCPISIFKFFFVDPGQCCLVEKFSIIWLELVLHTKYYCTIRHLCLLYY